MSINNVQSAPLTEVEDIKNKISLLQQQLQQQAPGYEHLLRIIHENLSKDEATVHLLTDEEIGVIVAGLNKKKGIVIAEREMKSKKSSLKNTSVDDL